MTSRRRVSSSVAGLLCLASSLALSTRTASAQTMGFELVGSIKGPVEVVELDAERAYVSAQKALTVFDVSDPATPTRLGGYTFSHKIWGFQVVGSSIYVAADRFGLGILELSDAGVLRLQGSLTTPGQAKNVAVSGTTALVADQVEGIVVVDVSTPGKPTQMASVFLEGFATDVVISGSLAYASDRPTGLYVLDVSDPQAADLTTSLQSTVAGTYFGFPSPHLELVDPEGEPPLVVLVADGLLQPFDISDPQTPIQLSTYSTPGGVQRASFTGGLAYVADGQDGLIVLDLSTPSSPRVVGSYETRRRALDVAVADSLVLLAVRGEVLILQQTR